MLYCKCWCDRKHSVTIKNIVFVRKVGLVKIVLNLSKFLKSMSKFLCFVTLIFKLVFKDQTGIERPDAKGCDSNTCQSTSLYKELAFWSTVSVFVEN